MEIKNLELIEKIINNLYIPEELGEYRNQDESYSDSFFELEDSLSSINRNCSVAYGATKCVVIPSDSNVVIKIPINGYFEIDEESGDKYFYSYTEANDSYLKSESKESYIGHEDDYCRNEYYKYVKAVSAGFGDFFARLEVLQNEEGIEFYIQEKIIPKYNYEGDTRPSENSKNIIKSLGYEYNYMADEDWMAEIVDWYGEERALNFFKFLLDNNINDLHYGNLAYTEEGKPILFDLAGYRDE